MSVGSREVFNVPVAIFVALMLVMFEPDPANVVAETTPVPDIEATLLPKSTVPPLLLRYRVRAPPAAVDPFILHMFPAVLNANL